MKKIKYPYEFDPKKRKMAKDYRRGRILIYVFGSLLSLSMFLFILSTGYHIVLRDIAMQHPFPVLLYGLAILLILTFFKLPLTFYSTYVYEHKFKLSRYNISSWLNDVVKMTLIGYVFSLITIYFLYLTIQNFFPWWIYAGILYIIFMAAINYIYPIMILPILWKVHPYKDFRMKRKILNLCRKLGVTGIRNIVVIKESEKSVKPNAVFMGFGNSKKIGLFDNLLSNFTKAEIETVIGHELGHYVNKDILKGILVDAILIFPVLFAVDYVVRNAGPVFGVATIGDIASLPLIILAFGILEFLLMPFINAYSRHRESEADGFALDHLSMPLAQISTEKKLADLSLSDLKPPWIVEMWLFTHPATFRRIRMAQEWNRKHSKS